MKGDREKCLAAGMDGYVSKPLRPTELFAAMDRALETRTGTVNGVGS
jgi:CheY-like chemotaxis protein